MALSLPPFAELGLELKQLVIPVQINTSATVASIAAFARFGGANLYCHDDSQVIPAAATFVTANLSNTATPSVIGLQIPVGDCKELMELRVDSSSIVLVTDTGLTGVVFTRQGASSTGVGTDSHIYATLSLTGFANNQGTGSAQFTINCTYRATQPSH